MDTIKHTLTLYPSKPQRSQLNHRHFRKLSDFSRNTIQFDLCDLPIIRLLASKCNKYILKYLQHTLWTPSSIHLRSTHQIPHRSQLNHRHFRKLSDFSRNTIQFDTLRLPTKRLLTSKCNKYIPKYLQHTCTDTIKHTLTLYPSKSSEITTKSQTFQKNIRLLPEHNSIWHFAIYQSKDSSPLNVINIFWSIFNTHYGHHQAYTYALAIKILRDPN